MTSAVAASAGCAGTGSAPPSGWIRGRGATVVIKWIDDLLVDWGIWMRSDRRDGLGYQESILGRLRRNPVVDHSATRYGMPISWSARDERMEEVSRVVNSMPRQMRRVVLLYYVQGLTMVTVARLCRVSESTARRRRQDGHGWLSAQLHRDAA